MISTILATTVAAMLATAPLPGMPPTAKPVLDVVTSTTDLRDIAQEVGGTRVSVVNISEGYQDPHFVEAKPSFILKLRDADVFAFVGLDLEIGWMPLLVQGARNSKIMQGGSGYLDVSKAIPVIDVPSGNVDRSQGDVHPLGSAPGSLDDLMIALGLWPGADPADVWARDGEGPAMPADDVLPEVVDLAAWAEARPERGDA